MFEFSMLFFARGAVVDACRAGAKQATLQGATQADVEVAVPNPLGGRLQENAQVETSLGKNSGDPVSVAVSVLMNAAVPTRSGWSASASKTSTCSARPR